MRRPPSTYALVVVVFAASAWVVGSAVRELLQFGGAEAQYAADVGGLAALAAFLLMAGSAAGYAVVGALDTDGQSDG
jgi:hypothetical protein